MINVQFKGKSKGRCAWCGKDKERLFEVEFADKSFVGRYCQADLMKAIDMKCQELPRAEQPKAVPANGPAAVK